MDAGIRGYGAGRVLFPLPSGILRLFDGEAFMWFFHDSLFDLAPVLLAFRRLPKVDWSESLCVGTFQYSFANGAVEHLNLLRWSAENEVQIWSCYVWILFQKLLPPGCRKTIFGFVTMYQ